MKKYNVILLIAVSLFLSACSSNKLIFITKTSFGVDIGINGADNGAHIGFKRFEGVIDPLKGCTKNGCTKGRKAQSVLAKLNFGVNQENKQNANVAQWFATGEAATILADKDTIYSALTGKDIRLTTYAPDQNSKCIQEWLNKNKNNKEILMKWQKENDAFSPFFMRSYSYKQKRITFVSKKKICQKIEGKNE